MNSFARFLWTKNNQNFFYDWSSHRRHIRSYNRPLWLDTEEVVGRFGGSSEFHRFVVSNEDDKVGEFYRKRRHGPILGSEEFREKVMKVIGKVSPEHPQHE